MLRNKTVLVVGGSSGIGLAVARLAREKGARVVVASRNAPHPGDLAAGPRGGPIEAYPCDITSGEEIEGLFEATGPVDHLVITVRPVVTPSAFVEVDIEEARRAFDTKFWGPFRLIQAARRHMRRHGSITLTSGIAGEKIYEGASVMATVNSAVETLGRALAVELAPLRVNVVSPGFVEPKPKEVARRARRFPLRRLASPDEVALAYLHLMTNPYVTGTVAVVDGGARLG